MGIAHWWEVALQGVCPVSSFALVLHWTPASPGSSHTLLSPNQTVLRLLWVRTGVPWGSLWGTEYTGGHPCKSRTCGGALTARVSVCGERDGPEMPYWR